MSRAYPSVPEGTPAQGWATRPPSPCLERGGRYDWRSKTGLRPVQSGDWCNGSTSDSDSLSLGSNPRSPIFLSACEATGTRDFQPLYPGIAPQAGHGDMYAKPARLRPHRRHWPRFARCSCILQTHQVHRPQANTSGQRGMPNVAPRLSVWIERGLVRENGRKGAGGPMSSMTLGGHHAMWRPEDPRASSSSTSMPQHKLRAKRPGQRSVGPPTQRLAIQRMASDIDATRSTRSRLLRHHCRIRCPRTSAVYGFVGAVPNWKAVRAGMRAHAGVVGRVFLLAVADGNTAAAEKNRPSEAGSVGRGCVLRGLLVRFAGIGGSG